MTARGFAAEPIENELDRLSAEKLQDDKRFAESYIRYRLGRGNGPTKIRAELRARGVDEGLSTMLFERLTVDWHEHAHAAWLKKFKHPARDYPERAKQARFLMQRGFTMEQINQVLDPR